MTNDTQARIIEVGAEIIHRQGYNKTGIKEILDAAGVPKGSFYFYFPSKEDFGLAVIDWFVEFFGSATRRKLGDTSIPPLERLKAMFRSFHDTFAQWDYERGCPIGNLSQEMGDLSPRFRERLDRALSGMSMGVRRMLDEAAERSELPDGLDTNAAGEFIVSAWEGALLRMKTTKSREPLDHFEEMVFNRLLVR